jgi:hypothetical protein
MERVWERKPFKEQGQFFQAGFPGRTRCRNIGSRSPTTILMVVATKLEIAVTALSMNSKSMQFAGERDYSPISFFGGRRR